MTDFLFSILGLKTGHAVAGLAGGTTAAIISNGTWRQATALIFVGVIATPCITPSVYFAVIYRLPFIADPSVELGLGFLIGLTSMVTCAGFISLAKAILNDPTILLRLIPWFRK